jgi:cytochrome c-type biogenesis protein CcmF
MGSFGTFATYFSLLCVLVTIVAAVISGRKSDPGMERVAEYGTYGTAIALSIAVGALQLALLTTDYSLQYVQDYTSSTLSPLYRVGSMWAGQGGSLLLWAWLVSLFAAWITYANKAKNWQMSVYTQAVFAVVAGLFAMLVAFFASPFVPAAQAVSDGFGLNPLLQDPLQIIHPLALYAGYVLYTVPFAIIVGSLIKGDVSGPWLKIANRWNVIAWIALTAGIVLGARWAYAELGWGGYWAWDPVENASLLPWLTGTILLHTGMTFRGGSRLRLASVIVTMVTFNLCLFGTFLTRSGVISSVHAFGESNLGVVLGGAIGLFVLACGVLVVWRLPQLRVINPDRRARGWLGQLLLLLLLVAITVAVLWGTMYPLFARVLNGQEIAVTPGFFRVVVTPLGIAILGLFAISPLLPGQSVADTKREIGIRLGVFVAVFGAIMLVTHGANFGVALVLALATLAIMTVVRKATPRVKDGYENDQSPILGAIRATGPYVGHVGLVVLLTAVTLNVAFQAQGQGKVALGKTATIGNQVVRLDKVDVEQFADRTSFVATASILNASGEAAGTLDSKLQQFNNAEQLHADVGILSTVAHDVYVVVDEADATPGKEFAVLTVYDNPAVIWIWIGGFLLMLGGVLFAIPRRRRVAVDAMAEEGETVQDDELTQLLDAAIVAARSGQSGAAGGDPVSDLLSKAQELSASKHGGTADQDDVVAFLEQAKARAADDGTTKTPSPKDSSGSGSGGGSAVPAAPKEKGSRTPLFVLLGLIAIVLIGGAAYLAGHASGASVPGINADAALTNAEAAPASGAPAASAAPAIDQAKVAELMKKITADPKDAKSLRELGNLYYTSQDFPNALIFYKKVVDVSPTDDDAWVAVGAASFNAGDVESARDSWMQASTVNPKNQEALYDLGFAYLAQKTPDNEKAKAAWQQVVSLDPKTQWAQDAQNMLQQHLSGSGKPSASAAPSSSAGQ